jgi:hypothetical protein
MEPTARTPFEQIGWIIREKKEKVEMHARPATYPFLRVFAGLMGTSLAVQAMRFTLGKPLLVPHYLPIPIRLGAWVLGTVMTMGGFLHAFDYYYKDAHHQEWTRV